MRYLKYSILFLVLLAMCGAASAQTAPVFTTNNTVYDVRENDFSEFNVRVVDADNDPLTVSFDINPSHITLDTVSASPGSGGLVFNRFTVPSGSMGSTIEIEATVTDNEEPAQTATQTISFNVTGINYPPDITIVVDGGSGLGTEENPYITPTGVGLGLDIDDQNGGFSPYGYNWRSVKLSGSFCPGAASLMWNADVEPGLLQIGRMITGGTFRISHTLEDGANVVTDQVIVFVDAAPDGCSPSSGLEDVSFTTNLPSNEAAYEDRYQVIGRATADASVTFMMFAASTDDKPVSPLFEETRSDCSSGCTQQWSRGAPSYDASQYYWLDVTSGGQSESRSLVVTVSDDGGGGGTSPLPTGCTGDTWNDCSSSCSSLTEFKVDAGCPTETILGGANLELEGNLITSQPQPFGEPLWEIADPAGFSVSELWIEDETRWDAVLHTSVVTEETTVTVRLSVESTGCDCSDEMDVVLLPDDPSGGDSADLSVDVPNLVVAAGLEQEFGYRVTVANLGPDPATGITLTHTVPAEIAYVSSDPDICGMQAGVLNCGLANLPANESSNVDLVFRGDAVEEVKPLIEVFANQFDPVESNDSRELTVTIGATADLVLSVVDSSEAVAVAVGQHTELEFEVENLGPDGASSVMLTMSLPEQAGTSVVSSEPQCTVGASSIICELGDLEADETVHQSITLKMTVEGLFGSDVSLSGDEFDPEEDDNEGDVEFIVTEVTSSVFPHSLNVDSPFPSNRYIGIAVFNPNSNATDVEFTGFDKNGQELGRILLSDMEGRGVIPGNGQSAMLTHEIFQGEDVASIIANGTNGPVQLFFMLGDYNQTSLDGVAGPLPESELLIFPIARSDDDEATVLFLFNSSKDDEVEATFQLYDGNGEFVMDEVRSLGPQGALAEELKTVFGIAEIDGYVKVMGDGGVLKGFEVYSQGKGISALVAQAEEKVVQLVAPHYIARHDADTSLWLQNVGKNGADAVIRGYDNEGALVGEYEFRFEAGQRFTGNVTDLLPLEFNGAGATGYLVIDFVGDADYIFQTDPVVVGAVTFTAFDGETIATLPLRSEGGLKSRFLHIAQNAARTAGELDMFTGMAILNLSGATANVTVRAFDEAGQLVGEQALDPLAHGTRVVDLLNGRPFFQAQFRQVGGHFEIESDQEVVIFALFGGYDGSFLSAIEGQSFE